jgi:hypothetical protein
MAKNADLSDAINPTAAILLPVAWAGVSGLAGGAIAASLAVVNHSDSPLAWGGLAAGATFTAGWLYGLSWWSGLVREILGAHEASLAPAYQAETTTLKLSIDWDEGRAGAFDDLHIDDAAFIQWACEVAKGKSLGENHWTGRANPFSKGEYHAMIDRLEYLGFVRLKGKGRTGGYELTGKGRAVCRGIVLKYAGDLPSPYPAGQRYLSDSALSR